MVKFDFNLVPKDALAYLRNKGYKLRFDYGELQKEAHHKDFTVAKVTRLALLHDIFKSLDK
ncbi:MAG: phage head morphogenesis protein, partial [Sulfurimonas sp.]|nr:phage head morphogenesis protein [Sulfurimonas sp.]